MPPSDTQTNPPVTPTDTAAETGQDSQQELLFPDAGAENTGETTRSVRTAGGSGSIYGSLNQSNPPGGSAYDQYDAHELLDRISQYEDERRWQRIREGIWISILAHIVFFALLYFVPRYVFNQVQVINPIDAIKQRKDLTYLDELPDALKEIQKVKPKLPPIKPNQPLIDKKTLDALKAEQQAKPQPTPAPPPAATLPQASPPPLPPSVAQPQANPQVALDSPRPSPVPARPNFSLQQQSESDQLRQAMHGPPTGDSGGTGSAPLSGRPEAGTGALQVLSDLQGVDFSKWFPRVVNETRNSWDPLIPEEVMPPIYKRGIVAVRFKVDPNGRVIPGSMALDGRSGDVALDRAAWGAITSSNYPPVPKDFHGPFVEMRIYFLYNTKAE